MLSKYKPLSFIKNHKSEVIIGFVLALFCVFAMFDLGNASATSYVKSSFNFALSNVGIIAGLKILCGILPFSDGISEILDKIFSFFFVANILIGIQHIMLVVNKILLIKILIVLFFAMRFIPRFKILATKILIVLLFLNPGLNFYINLVKITSNQANFEMDSQIKREILGIKKILGIVEMPEIDLEFNDSRSASQKIIGGIGLFSNKINSQAKALAETLSKPVDSTKEALEAAKQKIYKSINLIATSLDIMLQLVIQYILNVFFLYVVMPAMYFYILYRIVSSKNRILAT